METKKYKWYHYLLLPFTWGGPLGLIITVVITIITIWFFSGCVSKRETINTTNQTLSYNVKEETTAMASMTRFWILFIPIGFGSKTYEMRKEAVIQRFLKHTKADAIQNGRIVDRRITIPLIVFTYQLKWSTFMAKPCYLKTDSLKK